MLPRIKWKELGALLVALLWLAGHALGQSSGTAGPKAPADSPAVRSPAVQSTTVQSTSVKSTSVQSTTGQPTPISIRSIQLRKEGEELKLQFNVSQPVDFEVVGNLRRRVLVVKFTNARPVFPDGKVEFAYNDPMVVGVAFEDVNGRDTWAKIKLRTPFLTYKVMGTSPSSEMVLSLKPAPFPEGILLTGVRMAPYRGGTRIVMDVSSIPLVEDRLEGDEFTLRLKGVTPNLPETPKGDDNRVSILEARSDGGDTVLRVRIKNENLQPRFTTLPAPPRVLVDFRVGKPVAVRGPAPPPGGPRTPRPPGDIPLEVLLDRANNPLIAANFRLAEREFQSESYRRANLIFLRVFDTAPNTLVGVRAYFRAADAQYEDLKAQKATNYHDVIINFQAAIRAAEQIGYRTGLIPSSLFKIGRAYQRMGFFFESNVHYQILQTDYPDYFPFTPDSYYFQGVNYLEMGKFQDGVNSFQRFLASEGDDSLQGPAHYRLGDAYYNLKKFVESKTEFDKGREIAPAYPDDYPLLLFHMSEAFYENADFDVARILYQKLLDRYPEKSYTKLVGLRLGDFLREEGKEVDALRIYRLVVKNAPVEIRLRGKVRIANLLASHPTGNDYKESLKLYDEVLAEGEGRVIYQEALLRKGLTMTLHGLNQGAIDAFEKLKNEFPEGPYARENLLKNNIEENLKSMVDRFYHQKKYWDVVKVYTHYRDRYFGSFRFPFTLLQVGDAYRHLGLYAEAITLYGVLKKLGDATLIPIAEYQTARAYLEKDDLGAAEQTLLRFIQRRKKDIYQVDARMMLGKVYSTGRRYQDALKAFNILANEYKRSHDPVLGESIAEVYFELAQIYKELGRDKDALDNFLAAVDNFHHPIQGASVPEFIILSHFQTGDMFYALGQDQDAIDAYQRAVSLYGDHPKGPWAQYQIGLTYRRMGEDRKALQVFDSLVELAKLRPGELWEPLSRESRRDLTNKLGYQDYLNQ